MFPFAFATVILVMVFNSLRLFGEVDGESGAKCVAVVLAFEESVDCGVILDGVADDESLVDERILARLEFVGMPLLIGTAGVNDVAVLVVDDAIASVVAVVAAVDDIGTGRALNSCAKAS
jgi:hypothetical protein